MQEVDSPAPRSSPKQSGPGKFPCTTSRRPWRHAASKRWAVSYRDQPAALGARPRLLTTHGGRVDHPRPPGAHRMAVCLGGRYAGYRAARGEATPSIVFCRWPRSAWWRVRRPACGTVARTLRPDVVTYVVHVPRPAVQPAGKLRPKSFPHEAPRVRFRAPTWVEQFQAQCPAVRTRARAPGRLMIGRR